MSNDRTETTSTRVAAAQFASAGDVEENLQQIAALAKSAKQAGAKLVAFPEASTYDWQAYAHDIMAFAHKYGVIVSDELGRIAAENDIALVAGHFAMDDGRVRKRMLAYARTGTPFALYAKVQLYETFSDSDSEKVEAAGAA